MQTGNYHHRNPYTQQPNANGVNPNNGIIVDGGAAQHINGDASPNPINVDPYNGNADDLQSQQPPVCNAFCTILSKDSILFPHNIRRIYGEFFFSSFFF